MHAGTDASAFRDCFSLAWKNPYVLRLAFSAGIGGLLFGYDTGLLLSLFLSFSHVYVQIHTHVYMFPYGDKYKLLSPSKFLGFVWF